MSVYAICNAITLGTLLVFTGCINEDAHSTRFYVQSSSAGKVGVWAKQVTMPRSGLSYHTEPKPIITEVDVTNVQVVRVDSGELALLFSLNEYGTRVLYRRSVTDNGRRLILVVNGEPIGVRQFDGAISDGQLYTFTELPDDELIALATSLHKNSSTVQNKIRMEGY